MTEYAVEHTGEVIAVGPFRPHPERVALVEARGALLYWDQLDLRAHPAAEIYDPDQASAWLWELYGPDAAGAILSATDAVTTEWTSPVLDAARRLAHVRWAEAWWPSSHAAAVPALSHGLLRAEAAASTAAVEHLLDDEDAMTRALEEVDFGALAALEAHPILSGEALALKAMLLDLAEDAGVEPSEEPAPIEPGGWTLAAGGSHAQDLVVASGTAPVSWDLVPQGLVDAAADASWTFAQRADLSILTVSVPAAPATYEAALTARIATAEIGLRRDESTGMFTGEVEAPQGFLMLPAAARAVHVFAPTFATATAVPDTVAETWRSAIVEFARERLTAPDAGLAERAAALDTP